MIVCMPGWTTDAEKRIMDLIYQIVSEQNIKWGFVNDSKTIQDCIDGIIGELVFTQEHAYPELTKEELEHFEQTKELIKKEKKRCKK